VIQIGPQIGGVVTEVHVERGARVNKGDPLFSLNRDRFQYKVDELEASVVLARQNVKELAAQLEAASANVTHKKRKAEAGSGLRRFDDGLAGGRRGAGEIQQGRI
jgi:multidrug resistance efflux pump